MAVLADAKHEKRMEQRAKRLTPKREVQFRGWVDYPWTVEEQAMCKEWAVTGDDLLTDLEELVGDGFTFRIVTDSRGGGTQVQVYGAQGDALTEGLAMSGRGSTAAKALKNFLFAHEQCGHDWASLESSQKNGRGYND